MVGGAHSQARSQAGQRLLMPSTPLPPTASARARGHTITSSTAAPLRQRTWEHHVLGDRCPHALLHPGAHACHVVAVLQQPPRQLQCA